MKINLGVFFGGNSVEHEVSIISAVQAMAAADKDKYNIVPVYISKDQRMYTGSELLDIESYKDLEALKSRLSPLSLYGEGGRLGLLRLRKKLLEKAELALIDVALPVVHGTNVEDGSLQGLLQSLGLPYAGSDVLSSAVGMDKHIMKLILKDAGLPVLDGLLAHKKDFILEPEALFNTIEERFSYPVIVKPVNLGSSVGISLARDRAELEEALAFALEFAKSALVERAVTELREINCSVLGDLDEAEASVCEEPLGGDEILSYSDKYLSSGKSKGMSGSKRRIPADIPDETREKIQALAVSAFQALRCSGVARVDFLLDKQSGEIFVNELNTIPGSLSFYLWQQSGLPFDHLIDRLVGLALKRQRESSALTFSYDTNILASASFGSKGAKG